MNQRAATASGNGWARYGEGTFMFSDPKRGILLRLKNTKSDDGHTYADVHAFLDSDTGAKPALLMTRPKVNLTSDRSIPGLVKSLSAAFARYRGEDDVSYDWGALLEKVCAVLVMQMDEHGNVTELTEMAEADVEQPMLFKSFIPKDLVSGMVAHGGVGKSLIGAMLALAVATGKPVGPFEPVSPIPGTVLYLDWENGSIFHRRRLTRLCHGLGIDFPRNIIHYEARGKLTSAESEIVELAYDRGAVLSILDSIGFAAGGNLNDNEVATSAVNVLKHVPGTKVMIAHVNKASVIAGAAGNMGPTGSAFFWNGPQALYELKANDPEQDGSVTFAVYQPKANVGRRLKDPLGVKVQFMDPGGSIIPESVVLHADDAIGESESLPHRILAALSAAREMVTVTQVAERLKMDDKGGRESVARALRELREQGKAHSFAPEFGAKHGPRAVTMWGLAAHEDSYSAPAAAVVPVDESWRCAVCGKQAVGYGTTEEGLCSEHL